MTIRFNPPQLRAARHASTLCRVAQELAPAEFEGELRVLQHFPDEPTRLVLIRSGRWPASLEVPRNWLYADIREQEVRERLAELMHSFANPALAA